MDTYLSQIPSNNLLDSIDHPLEQLAEGNG